jgi:hypothetical protein
MSPGPHGGTARGSLSLSSRAASVLQVTLDSIPRPAPDVAWMIFNSTLVGEAWQAALA